MSYDKVDVEVDSLLIKTIIVKNLVSYVYIVKVNAINSYNIMSQSLPGQHMSTMSLLILISTLQL
jgi:hypothetical protein